MPNETQHICVALHNIDAAKYLLADTCFSDWVCCAVFYSALHIVDAVLFHNQKETSLKHGGTHDRRCNVLKYERSYEHMYRHYIKLAHIARVARYIEDTETGEVVFFNTFMSPEQVENQLVKHHFWQVIVSASKFLSARSAKALQQKFNKHFSTTTP